jgi:hypothetical protein
MPTPTKRTARATKRVATKAANEPTLSSPSVQIFQIHYKGDQKEHLDPAFTEFDNKKGEAETHEFAVFEALTKTKQAKEADYWGAVSWRFGEKTGLKGEQLLKIVRNNPAADVFYMNPYPYNEALFQSGWMQGETVHPDFLALAEKVLVAAGFDANEVHRVTNSAGFSSANYFVGNQKFWAAYIPFVQTLLAGAEKKLPASVLKILHSSKADPRNLHNQSTYVPFIVERLFPLFMSTAGKSLAAAKVALPEQEKKLNEHLRKLREMKDTAVKGKSEWLLRAWMNYRNLYLQSAAPKDWCQKYLPVLNPKEIVW